MGPRATAWDHVIKLDTKTKRGGASSLQIQSTKVEARSLAGVIQGFSAEPYRGTRVRLRGSARVSTLSQWAGLMMRIESPTVTAFDNMQGRPFQGTTDWATADIVLDVPVDAFAIYVGALVVGSGTVWIDDFEFDSVPRSVATTGRVSPRQEPVPAERDLLPAPANLGFEPGK